MFVPTLRVTFPTAGHVPGAGTLGARGNGFSSHTCSPRSALSPTYGWATQPPRADPAEDRESPPPSPLGPSRFLPLPSPHSAPALPILSPHPQPPFSQTPLQARSKGGGDDGALK